MGIGWGGMGEGLGRWKVAAYGVSLGIDFTNLDCQKTAQNGHSSEAPEIAKVANFVLDKIYASAQ